MLKEAIAPYLSLPLRYSKTYEIVLVYAYLWQIISIQQCKRENGACRKTRLHWFPTPFATNIVKSFTNMNRGSGREGLVAAHSVRIIFSIS